MPKVEKTADITFEQLKNKTIQNIAVNDKYLLILALDYNAKTPEDLSQYDEEENPDINYYFYIWNINYNKLKKEYVSSSKEFDCISDIKLSEDNKITVYCFDDKPESKIYDFNFKEIGTTKETALSIQDKNDKLANENELIDSSRYAIYNNVSNYSHYIENDLMVFLDDDQNIYINSIDKSSNVVNCIGRTVYYMANDIDKLIEYSYVDYDNNVKKETSLEYNSNYYPCSFAVGNTYSAISLQDEECQIQIVTVINNNAMTSTTADIEKINVNDIENKIAETENEIRKEFTIDIETGKEYDENSTINSYIYDNEFSSSELLLTLFDIKYCLSTFPKEFYQEILDTDGEFNFSKFKLYVVGNFDDESNGHNISAYCSDLGIDNELFIVYSISGFNTGTFYHEFMHAMENRISNHVNNFDERWKELNPDDFEYTYGDQELSPYYDNENNQNYFARDYGTTNALEDRATVFEELCASAFNNEKNPYWAEKKPIVKKAKYLHEIISKSFPSLADKSFKVWEMYDDILN
ncbi:MAG: hypothetical protein NC213_02600 [Acetobacter sp.]|nr:hypothetical protein [Bacteroides sp.]MCM1340610.1 hypothetical protein [Acetobacter sp.]MCM1433350.1 hypothetical protein [Clostridiales bacterium]